MWQSTPYLDRYPIGVMRGVFLDITDADDAFLQIVGYTRDDFESGVMHWPSMTPPEYFALDEAGMRQAAESGGFTAPYRKQFIRKDGSRVDVLLVCAFIPETEGGWIGYVADLSPTRAAHANAHEFSMPLKEPPPLEMLGRLVSELIRERTRILLMLDSSEALIWAVDRNMCLLSCNEAFQQSQAAVSGRRLSVGDRVIEKDDYPEHYLRPWVEWYGRAFAGESFTVAMHYEHTKRSDIEFLLTPIRDADGVVAGATIVAHDVTKREEAQRLALAHEQRFQRLVESVPVGVLVADADGGLITLNERAARILSLASPSVAPGHQYLDAVVPEDRALLQALWTRALAEGRADCTVCLRDANGNDRLVRWNVEPLPGNATQRTELGRFVGTVEDETERTTAVERQRQREKMESLGTLAGGIAHDFNNMLSVILSYAEAGSEAGQTEAEYLDAFDNIRAASTRARDLVRQILAFSRRDRPQQRPVDIAQLTADTTRLLRAVIPMSVTLDVTGVDAPAKVLGDASSLQQVVLNLVMNAAHAVREVPIPRITVRLSQLRLPTGDVVRLEVGDNGCGMPRQVRERIFEPFYTTKPVGEGTGMGLAVVRGIIDSHRGDVQVWSEPGRGSRFTMTLPLDRSETELTI